MKFHRTCAAAALGFYLLIAPAKADTISTFNVSALGNPQECLFTCPLGGDIVINTSNGSIVSANVTITGLGPVGPFTNFGLSPISRQVGAGFITELIIADAVNDKLHLFLPVVDLIGYPGGPICVADAFFPPCLRSEITLTFIGGSLELVSGSLTPAPVPIPAALPLFATGLGVLGLLGWRRKKKSAALAP